MALYTESGDARVYSVTPDLLGDVKVMNTINNGISPVAARLLAGSETFNPVSHRIAVKKSKNNNQIAFQGLDTFPTAMMDTRVVARFEPRAIEQSVILSGLEQDINALGNAQKIDYTAVEIGSGAEDFAEFISDQIYDDGTSYSNKGIIGFGLAVDSTGTYANISRSTVTTWASSEYDISASSHSTSIANSDNGFNILRRMLFGGTDAAGNVVTATVYGSQMPTLIVMPKTLWPSFEALYQQTVTGSAIGQGLAAIYNPMVARTTVDRYGKNLQPSDVQSGRAGFSIITYMGIPMIWDEHCPSGTIFFLNENTIQWAGIPSTKQGAINYDLLKGPVKFEGANTDIKASIGVTRLQPQSPFAQYGEATYFMLHGALIVNPKFNGKVTGVTV